MTVALALALAVAAVAVVGLVALHREALRRVLLGTVDPRPLALFRIALGLCLLAYVVEIAPLSTYLFSDEGLLPSAAVPQVYGRGAFRGAAASHGDGIPTPVFTDAWSLLEHLAQGRWSLLYFWDDPAFVHAYVATLGVVAVGMVIGWRARVCTGLAWLLLIGLLRRGDAHWGGEQVFVGLLFGLMFARSGAAYGVDAWRRNRALARRGQLDLREGPTGGRGAPPSPEHPLGLAAIYPRVPAWPQVLLVVQLAICYCANGWTKSGETWVTGDTLRLAVHLDKYARLDWHGLAVALGPWPFRLATWSVLWWERLFPLLLVGLWLRAAARSGAAPLHGRARLVSRACWLVLAAALLGWALVPGALAEDPAVARARAVVLGVGAGGLALGAALGPRLPTGVRRWALRGLDPRAWLGFGLVFHAVSLVLFEIGSFASATVSAYLLCGLGPIAVAWVQRGARALARLGVPVPAHLRGQSPVEAEDPSLPHLHHERLGEGAALPGWAIAGAGALVLAGAGLALDGDGPRSIGWWHGGWLLAAAGLVAVGWRTSRRRAPTLAPLPTPLAYGPVGRLAAGGVLTYHVVALLAWQLPPWPSLPWRNHARALVDPWMELSFTRQLWSMFAPNGPRRNTSVRTTVVDAAGVTHDLRTELQHPENLRRPYLRHDRWRKVDEAVGGSRAWLAPWHARYLCRRWALEHEGVPPTEVRLERVTAPFPPMQPLDAQAWFRANAKVEPIVRARCAAEPFAQLAPEARLRHGLPAAAEGELRYAWPKSPPRRDPYQPLWVALALGLVVVMSAWSRHARSQRD